MKAHHPKDIYSRMVEAYNKASEKSQEYNDLEAEIAKVERETGDVRGLSNGIVKQRIDERKAKDEGLKAAYNGYSFWKGEVERNSALLQGHLAYMQIRIEAVTYLSNRG